MHIKDAGILLASKGPADTFAATFRCHGPCLARSRAAKAATVHLYGYSREEFLTMTIKDVRRPKDVAVLMARGAFLTLHGGSGTADQDFIRAIQAGITIIHVNTELRLAWRHGVEDGLNAQPNEIAPCKILPAAVKAVGAIVARRLRLFNNLSQAPASAA